MADIAIAIRYEVEMSGHQVRSPLKTIFIGDVTARIEVTVAARGGTIIRFISAVDLECGCRLRANSEADQRRREIYNFTHESVLSFPVKSGA